MLLGLNLGHISICAVQVLSEVLLGNVCHSKKHLLFQGCCRLAYHLGPSAVLNVHPNRVTLYLPSLTASSDSRSSDTQTCQLWSTNRYSCTSTSLQVALWSAHAT